MKKYLVDTNVILYQYETLLKNDNYIMLSHVLREIEKHEHSSNQELSFRSRQLKRFLNEHDNISFDLKDYKFNLNETFDEYYEDNRMLQACVENNYGLVTNDILLKMKAEGFGVEVIVPSETENIEIYLGSKEVLLNDEERAYLYEHLNENIYELETNEYLIVMNEYGDFSDKLKWNGKVHTAVKWKKISSKFLGDTKPRNLKQELLFNMIQDKNITVKVCLGRFGSGKDYCMIAHALNLIEDGVFDKLVFCRNQIPLKDSPESGFRKGDNFEKMVEFAMPLADAVGGVEMLRLMVERGQIELQDLSRIRGRDIKNSIIYVTEFQNNSREHARLLLARVGENSQLWVNGDLLQTDKDIFKTNSAIAAITELRGNELYGQVTLDKTERSKTASLSELIK